MARAITSHFGPDRARILLADPVGGPLAPLVPYLAQCVHIGLHLVVSRSTSGAMRAMMGPLLRGGLRIDQVDGRLGAGRCG
ncbi:hypothetical protein, partial [Streptomyces decoyicus]|uniref:hypothetical protein n=1 Tax=Streptomyces decoyicus TaxID=249567 RepID=UPI0033B62396